MLYPFMPAIGSVDPDAFEKAELLLDLALPNEELVPYRE